MRQGRDVSIDVGPENLVIANSGSETLLCLGELESSCLVRMGLR